MGDTLGTKRGAVPRTPTHCSPIVAARQTRRGHVSGFSDDGIRKLCGEKPETALSKEQALLINRRNHTFALLTLILLTGCGEPRHPGAPLEITGKWIPQGAAGPEGSLILKEDGTFIAHHLPERALPLPAPALGETASAWTSADHITGTWTTRPGTAGSPEVLVLEIDGRASDEEIAIKSSGAKTDLSYSYRNAESADILNFTRP